jgi:hypothetical protein
MSDSLFHIRTVEEVLSDDNAGASDKCWVHLEILAYVYEYASDVPCSSFACSASTEKHR